MKKTKRLITRYSESFKHQVVSEVEKGFSISSVARKYDIRGGDTIQRWIAKFGKDQLLNQIIRVEMKGEKDRVKELEKELKSTKEALADSVLAQRLLENLIDLANKEYQTDLKKNFGSVVSSQKK
jgi:transposase-like protein